MARLATVGHRRFCPRCGDVMLLEYRKRRDYDYWAWAWWCPSCRHEELAAPYEVPRERE